MYTMTIFRTKTGDSGTFGKTTLPSGKVLYTAELPSSNPWVLDFTCVPVPDDPLGYLCQYAFSPKHNKNVYHVRGVKDSPNIEIHVGNFSGDTRIKDTDGSQLYQSDVLGCILMGESEGQRMTTHLTKNKMQDAVISSTQAIADFEKEMNQQDFRLKIVWL